MCGVVAVYSPNNTLPVLYQGLQKLQHRGQDAAGIAVLHPHLSVRHHLGTVETLGQDLDVAATLGIGHTRYPTSGSNTLEDVQPFVARSSLYHIALAHSGHIQNVGAWRHELNPRIHISASTVDSNLLLHLLITRLEQYPQPDNEPHFFSLLCQVVHSLLKQVQGAYSVVCLIEGRGLVVFRDPQGVRPLVMGTTKTQEVIVASESHFFNAMGYEHIEEVRPGELIYISSQGARYHKVLQEKTATPCSFEYIYFANPQSVLDGVSVTQTRQNMGTRLAALWKTRYPDLIPDYVLPIPNTANSAAAAFAQALQVDYTEEFEVNPQSGRTFISSEEASRNTKVQEKLHIAAHKVTGKIILLFDDSIVRGTTAKEVIAMLRQYAAKKIYFVSACPPIINTCSLGINIPSTNELLAHQRSLDEIRQHLAVDILLYPDVSDLLTAIGPFSEPLKKKPCVLCMS